LILVSLYFLTGIDDTIWNIITLTKRLRVRNRHLDLRELDSVPPKLFAVVIAAWHEDNVLGDVIDNFLASTHYPKSMYHVFLGVYPNDEPTIAEARALSARHGNVHAVINPVPGPTSKAQNINYVITQIKEYEKERGWHFTSFTIHDAEDVVHPYELKVTNYLLESRGALQFPVFPLVQMPSLRNFFKTITASTYLDEFAENHFITVVNRRDNGAFVPSAGTGFALSREVLDSFGSDEILPSNSLTEDYRLSLTLYQRGIQMYFVLEKVPRVSHNNKVVWDYISTRSMFPNTFAAAVKQKTRWILGITMQSFKFTDIFRFKNMPFSGRYSLYKDQKAKVGNLLAFAGYPVIVYFLISLFIPLTPIFPVFTLSWWLSLAVTFMMLERQIFRSIAIFNIYGLRSVFYACLFPPILPIRLVWGNIINLTATIRAYRQFFFGNKSSKSSKKVKKLAWAKTDHTFLPKRILSRYHRRLGDIFLEKGFVTTDKLQEALQFCAKTKINMGEYFISKNEITEHQLLIALSEIKQIQYLEPECLSELNLRPMAAVFDKEILRGLHAAPIYKSDTGYVMAFCEDSPSTAQTLLRNQYNISVHAVFASRTTIEQAIKKIYTPAEDETAESTVTNLHEKGLINYEQALLAYKYKTKSSTTEEEILRYMGLLPPILQGGSK